MALTKKQLEQRRQAGLALKASKPEGYFKKIGGKGGRPTYAVALERAQARLLAAQQVSRPGRKRKEVAGCTPPGPAK